MSTQVVASLGAKLMVTGHGQTGGVVVDMAEVVAADVATVVLVVE